MKRILSVVILIIIILSCSSCTQQKDISPEITRMKSICELATLKCYYHNVAKYHEKDVEGLIWKKDRRFWIEYSGIVTIGIDASQLDISITDNNVTITIPPAKVLSSKVDETTLTEDSFFIDSKSADIEAEHQTEAFKAAQSEMLNAASNDTALLSNAQQRAMDLLEDYVHNIGNIVNKEYKVNFIELNEENPPKTTEQSPSA